MTISLSGHGGCIVYRLIKEKVSHLELEKKWYLKQGWIVERHSKFQQITLKIQTMP